MLFGNNTRTGCGRRGETVRHSHVGNKKPGVGEWRDPRSSSHPCHSWGWPTDGGQGVDPDGAVSGGNNLPMRAVDAPLPGPF